MIYDGTNSPVRRIYVNRYVCSSWSGRLYLSFVCVYTSNLGILSHLRPMSMKRTFITSIMTGTSFNYCELDFLSSINFQSKQYVVTISNYMYVKVTLMLTYIKYLLKYQYRYITTAVLLLE